MLLPRLIALGLGICVFAVASSRVSAVEGAAHRHTFGDIEVIALQDIGSAGRVNNPDLLIGLGKADAKKYLAKPDAMENSINAFVVKMNGKTYLFDTGLGKNGPVGGQLIESLAMAGISPYDIDAVIITHFHGDHIGGLVQSGRAVFPRAHLYVAKEEVDKWNPAQLGFLDVYGPRVHQFKISGEVVPGVLSLNARGHTPGHTVFKLKTDKGALLVAGDVIHFANIQMPLPDVAVKYDTNPADAIQARRRVFDLAAAEELPIAAMHIAFPGLGMVEKDGRGYVYTPIGK